MRLHATLVHDAEMDDPSWIIYESWSRPLCILSELEMKALLREIENQMPLLRKEEEEEE